MKSTALITLLLLTAPFEIRAHPHTTVEQQAILSLGRTEAILSYLIRPSTEDGAHMFDHLDSNGNASVEEDEESAFANELLAATALIVNGEALKLQFVDAAIPGRELLAAGGGLIEVKVRVGLNLALGQNHNITLQVTHDSFGESWFVQPHYYADLLGHSRVPELERNTGSTQIAISIPEQSAQ